MRLTLIVCLLLTDWGMAQIRQALPDNLLQLYQAFAKKAPSPEPPPLVGPVKGTGRVQVDDPAYPLLLVAFEALRQEEFDQAIESFSRAVEVAPTRTDIRKNLAYTYFKVGANEKARLQFEQVVKMDPSDYHSALEVAFLDYEIDNSGQRAEARRIFDRVRKEGDPESKATAESAFQFIDGLLADKIRSLTEAIRLDPSNLSARFRLARAAEERDDLNRALEQYRAAESPAAPSIFIDEARVLLALGRPAEAREALRKATLGSDPFAAEEAKDKLAALPQP